MALSARFAIHNQREYPRAHPMRTVVVAIVATLIAQLPASQQPTFRSGVDVVQVDVSVLDKDRRPGRGLTESAFTILEAGKPRPIVAFVPVELAEVNQQQA